MARPRRPGFYWAKWHTAEHNAGVSELSHSSEWEVVWVLENSTDSRDEEFLRVLVTGVEETQAIKNFDWRLGPLKAPSPSAKPSIKKKHRHVQQETFVSTAPRLVP